MMDEFTADLIEVAELYLECLDSDAEDATLTLVEATKVTRVREAVNRYRKIHDHECRFAWDGTDHPHVCRENGAHGGLHGCRRCGVVYIRRRIS